MINIRVQTEDFDQGAEYQLLAQGTKAGAVTTFVGRVRDFSNNPKLPMSLEHYPGMTEKSLHKIVEEAQKLWPLQAATIIHRVGDLLPGDQIVFVGVSTPHRKAAFESCQFIMDQLKTKAPFWKKEGGKWVDAKESDQHAAEQWSK